jgi:pyrroline-5-carboxylate reductase, NAD(P)-binding
MQQGLIEMGLDENQSRALVQQAMLGSAKLVIENPQTALSTLRENVTSKGGTTAAALNVFNQLQFNDIIKQAMQACVARSQEMEKLF